MPDEIVKVHDLAQESWYIGRNPCSCGGSFRKKMQILLDRDGTPIDRLVTKCDKCESVREFLFDISAFHGPAITAENMHLARLAEGVIDPQITAKVPSLIGSSVSKAAQTIIDLGKAGDYLALDWLEDAIRYARSTRSGA